MPGFLCLKYDNMVVVFDMDDTLFPEQAFVLSALTAVGDYAFKNWGTAGFASEAIALFQAGHRKDIFQQAFHRLGLESLSAAQADELLLAYRTHTPATLPWFPDALRVVQVLSKQFSLCLISDGFLPTQRNKAKALEVERWIPGPIFTEELGREYWKPSPKAYELVMQRHPGQNFMYVADNASKDFIAPNALGWRTVQIRRSVGQYRDTPAAPHGQPQHVIASFDELIPLL